MREVGVAEEFTHEWPARVRRHLRDQVLDEAAGVLLRLDDGDVHSPHECEDAERHLLLRHRVPAQIVDSMLSSCQARA